MVVVMAISSIRVRLDIRTITLFLIIIYSLKVGRRMNDDDRDGSSQPKSAHSVIECCQTVPGEIGEAY